MQGAGGGVIGQGLAQQGAVAQGVGDQLRVCPAGAARPAGRGTLADGERDARGVGQAGGQGGGPFFKHSERGQVVGVRRFQVGQVEPGGQDTGAVAVAFRVVDCGLYNLHSAGVAVDFRL